jgi:hypothetical protein
MTRLGARTLDLMRLKPLEHGSGSILARRTVCVALPLIAGAGELAVDLSAASVAGKGGLGSGSIAIGTGWSWCAAVSDIASTTAAG